MQEILVVAAIAVAIFFLPRWLGRTRQQPAAAPRRRLLWSPLWGWIRLSIMITLVWLAATAVFLRPWEDGLFWYLCIGPAPALVFWGGVWVWFGFKKYRR
ncbi:MAG TPA: hypothetical protein PK090_13100 [Smithellaceae bacterium]|nr:hypothetical protein [Smithellaceae bacterium]